MENYISPYFKIDAQLLLNDNCIISTNDIYENYRMNEWAHLLP
jgi:hypothetical protein